MPAIPGPTAFFPVWRMPIRDTVKIDFLARPSTIASVFGDFHDWHRGRSPYLLWGILLDQAPVRALAGQAAAHLAHLLAAGYYRQPHVTLGLCGFPAAQPHAPDEFGPADLARQLAELAAAALPPFDIVLGELASFAMAPFLHVAGDALAPLHRILHQPWPGPAQAPYVPHLTVGLYGGAWPSAEVQEQLETFADEPLSCRIGHIDLLAYQPSQIGGPLRRLAQFDLANGSFSWCGSAMRWPEQGTVRAG